MERSPFSVDQVRAQIPILDRRIGKYPLVYLDNGATTQKPRCVLEAIGEAYQATNANIHRGVHTLSQASTAAYEWARGKVAEYLGTPDPHSVIFTSGTTASINMLAFCLGESYLRPGDTILVSEMEHHSNLVPWQMLAQRKGLHLVKIPLQDDASLDMPAYYRLLEDGARLVCITHVSNVTGRVNPIAEMAQAAHAANARILVDGAQGIKHAPIDLHALGADYYVFSGHKIYAPTGIGVLWGRKELLEELPPWQGGGDMVATVHFERATYAELPFRLEAGTPPYIEAVGLGKALEFYMQFDPAEILSHEQHLLHAAHDGVSQIKPFHLLGYHPTNAAILSLYAPTMHPYDVGVLLDRMGIAVRTGTHCAEPLMRRFNLTGTLRASFALYNTIQEVHQLLNALERAASMLR